MTNWQKCSRLARSIGRNRPTIERIKFITSSGVFFSFTKLWQFESKQQADFKVFIWLDFRFCLFLQCVSGFRCFQERSRKSLYLIISFDVVLAVVLYLFLIQSLGICFFLLFANGYLYFLSFDFEIFANLVV